MITGVLISPMPDQEGNKLGSTSGMCAISTTSRRELSSCFFLQGKAPKEIHAIVRETLACFLPGQAKDLSAPLYIDRLDDGPSAEPDITEAKCLCFWHWQYRWDMAEGNFCNEGGKAIKPQLVTDYNYHMGYVDKGDRMANSYSISHRTLKWTKILFYHLLDLAILNSYTQSCGGKKISHRDFRYKLIRNMLAHAGPEQRVPRPLGRPPNVESHVTVTSLEVCSSKQWPIPPETQLRCHMCKARGVTRSVCEVP